MEYKEKNEAYERHSYIYTSYVVEKGIINERNHYTSEDGTLALVYGSCDGDGSWLIQTDQYRYLTINIYLQCNQHSMMSLPFRDERKCHAHAYTERDSTCPSEVGHNWKYGDGASWPDAGKGLTVKSISDTGIIRTRGKFSRWPAASEHFIFQYKFFLA